MSARIKVTRFSSTSGDVTDQVNQFLDERALGMADVAIQFVTSMVNIPFAEATISGCWQRHLLPTPSDRFPLSGQRLPMVYRTC
jgi:hypothetical protein